MGFAKAVSVLKMCPKYDASTHQHFPFPSPTGNRREGQPTPGLGQQTPEAGGTVITSNVM